MREIRSSQSPGIPPIRMVFTIPSAILRFMAQPLKCPERSKVIGKIWLLQQIHFRMSICMLESRQGGLGFFPGEFGALPTPHKVGWPEGHPNIRGKRDESCAGFRWRPDRE